LTLQGEAFLDREGGAARRIVRCIVEKVKDDRTLLVADPLDSKSSSERMGGEVLQRTVDFLRDHQLRPSLSGWTFHVEDPGRNPACRVTHDPRQVEVVQEDLDPLLLELDTTIAQLHLGSVQRVHGEGEVLEGLPGGRRWTVPATCREGDDRGKKEEARERACSTASVRRHRIPGQGGRFSRE